MIEQKYTKCWLCKIGSASDLLTFFAAAVVVSQKSKSLSVWVTLEWKPFFKLKITNNWKRITFAARSRSRQKKIRMDQKNDRMVHCRGPCGWNTVNKQSTANNSAITISTRVSIFARNNRDIVITVKVWDQKLRKVFFHHDHYNRVWM